MVQILRILDIQSQITIITYTTFASRLLFQILVRVPLGLVERQALCQRSSACCPWALPEQPTRSNGDGEYNIDMLAKECQVPNRDSLILLVAEISLKVRTCLFVFLIDIFLWIRGGAPDAHRSDAPSALC